MTERADHFIVVGLEWTVRKFVLYISRISGFLQQKRLFYSNANVIEYFHSKSILAFQVVQGGVFRAQGHLLTPSELRDTVAMVRTPWYFSEIPIVWHTWISSIFMGKIIAEIFLKQNPVIFAPPKNRLRSDNDMYAHCSPHPGVAAWTPARLRKARQ